MTDDDAATIARDPRYRALVRRRGRLTSALTAMMLVAYFGFIALVAFDKALLAQPIGDGVTSIGVVVGLALILLAIALTGIYVRSANRHYDALVAGLAADHSRADARR